MTIIHDPTELTATNTTRRERKPVLIWWRERGGLVWLWLKE